MSVPVLVIAEAGVNHNGDIGRAEAIDRSRRTGRCGPGQVSNIQGCRSCDQRGADGGLSKGSNR